MRLKKLSFVLVFVFIINVLASAGGYTAGFSARAASEGPQWSQAVIDAAVAASTASMNTGPTFSGSLKNTAGFYWSTNNYTAKAINMLAVMSYYDPDLKASSGKTVSQRLIEHINYITTGGTLDKNNRGNELSCRGFLGGWVDGPVAQALTLAKYTPAVWDNLTPEVQAKCDFTMKALTVVGNYTQNYRNAPARDMSQGYEAKKGYNPNFQEGYVGIMIAAYYYFGGIDATTPDAVNKILADFSYDEYIAQMDTYEYNSMKTYFQATGKTLLETGGTDAGGGVVYGARIPFTYSGKSGEVPYDPIQIYQQLEQKMYGREVISKISGTSGGKSVTATTANGTVSPYEGLMGMGSEFSSMDADGLRSSASYVNLGWMNSVPIRATLEALGVWKGDGVVDTESIMYVGTEDFLYKIGSGGGGWKGVQKGKYETKTEQDIIDSKHGYVFTKAIWDTLLKRETGFETQLRKSGSNAEVKVKGYNLSTTDSASFTAIAAVYDADGRLVQVETKPYTLNKLTSNTSDEKYIDKFTLPVSAGQTVKIFVWDSIDGMNALAEANELTF